MYYFGYRKYRDYIMFQAEKQTGIPNKDIDYVRDVYRGHTPHVISKP